MTGVTIVNGPTLMIASKKIIQKEEAYWSSEKFKSEAKANEVEDIALAVYNIFVEGGHKLDNYIWPSRSS